MEQEMRFGLVLGRLAILKKNLADYKLLLRMVISYFHRKKKFLALYLWLCGLECGLFYECCGATKNFPH